jgi:integrase/recombinase XerD
MGLAKQAKILSKTQVEAVLGYLSKTRYPIRNRVIFLLSVKAGLRAKEIACLNWEMLSDAEGEIGSSIHLVNQASKGRSGRIIPHNKELQSALIELRSWNNRLKRSSFVVATERAEKTSAAAITNLFGNWYSDLGFIGCSSHSGRRTAITAWARRISTVCGSLRDVQILAGHSALTTTQRYIEGSGDAQKRIVDLI